MYFKPLFSLLAVAAVLLTTACIGPDHYGYKHGRAYKDYDSRYGYSEIVNRNWRLVELRGETVNRYHAPGFKLHGKTAQLTGFDGCEPLRGKFTLDKKSNNVRFTSLTTPPGACTKTSLDDQFISVLANTKTYDIRGNALFLRDGSGTARAMLVSSFWR